MAAAPTRFEHVVYDSEYSRFSLEPFSDLYFIHQEVHRWCKGCYAETLFTIETMEPFIKLRVFVHPTNGRLKRYAETYGFRHGFYLKSPHDKQIYSIMRRP